MDSRCLVLFDANRIREYVFASGRLREIRGASEQVRQLTEAGYLTQSLQLDMWDPNKPLDEGIVYADGGAGAIVVASPDRARDVCRLLEARFSEQTGVATLTAVWEPIDDASSDAEAKAQRNAARALARQKTERPQAMFLPGGVVRFCESDRIVPANGTTRDPGQDEPILVSQSTANKHELSRTYRRNLTASPYGGPFISLVPEQDQSAWGAVNNLFQDVGSIGRQSDSEGYVALIYADGDGVGKAIRDRVRRDGLEGYQRISDALTNAATQATAESLAEAYGGRPPRSAPGASGDDAGAAALPFEVITIGGDDILLLCTAESGLDIARTLARTFERVTTELLGAPITVSVGVAIAHDTMPIGTMERIGRELLKSAKRIKDQSSIDFHIATASSIDHLSLIREDEYQVGDDIELTLRPYGLDQADLLVRHAKTLGGHTRQESELPSGQEGSGIPGSKRRQLYDACRGDQVSASLNVLDVHSRLGPSQSEHLLDALRDLGCHVAYPFTDEDDDGRRQTALVDLLEAAAFTGEPWSVDR